MTISREVKLDASTAADFSHRNVINSARWKHRNIMLLSLSLLLIGCGGASTYLVTNGAAGSTQCVAWIPKCQDPGWLQNLGNQTNLTAYGVNLQRYMASTSGYGGSYGPATCYELDYILSIDPSTGSATRNCRKTVPLISGASYSGYIVEGSYTVASSGAVTFQIPQAVNWSSNVVWKGEPGIDFGNAQYNGGNDPNAVTSIVNDSRFTQN